MNKQTQNSKSSSLAAPLGEMTQKDARFKEDKEENETFQKLKAAQQVTALLTHFSPIWTIVARVEASFNFIIPLDNQ